MYLKLYDVVVHQHEEYRRQQGLPTFDYAQSTEFTKMFVFRCKDIVPRQALNEEILGLFGQDLVEKQRRAVQKLKRYRELVKTASYKHPALPNSQLQFVEYDEEAEGQESDEEQEPNPKLSEMPPSQSGHDAVDSIVGYSQQFDVGDGPMRASPGLAFCSSSQEVENEGRGYLGKRKLMKECIIENQFWDRVRGEFREKYQEQDVEMNIKEIKSRLRLLFTSENKSSLRLDAVCEKLVRNSLRFSRQEVSQVIHEVCQRCPEFCAVKAVRQEGQEVEFLRLLKDKPLLVLSQ